MLLFYNLIHAWNVIILFHAQLQNWVLKGITINEDQRPGFYWYVPACASVVSPVAVVSNLVDHFVGI